MKVNGSGERSKQKRASTHTSPQTAVGETHTGSSTQFSSSVFSHAPQPFDVRENPFQKRQQGYVFTGLRLCVCVVMAEFVQAHCLHILYISRACTVCVCISVCLCQRGFPFASVAQSHTGRGREGWQSRRDCEDWPGNICSKAESVLHGANWWNTPCITAPNYCPI